ncbi:hypothetical protein Taro_018928 [Colocasia esculenta]|uniref:Uncharacterized protein n=1 Tax=Colocasia esculenta TaxID=4460 RepID=A0A843UV90_COLES|nr:hypothetical protein [Colocasia esculenta]
MAENRNSMQNEAYGVKTLMTRGVNGPGLDRAWSGPGPARFLDDRPRPGPGPEKSLVFRKVAQPGVSL